MRLLLLGPETVKMARFPKWVMPVRLSVLMLPNVPFQDLARSCLS
jgi:hypothetical protein